MSLFGNLSDLPLSFGVPTNYSPAKFLLGVYADSFIALVEPRDWTVAD